MLLSRPANIQSHTNHHIPFIASSSTSPLSISIYPSLHVPRSSLSLFLSPTLFYFLIAHRYTASSDDIANECAARCAVEYQTCRSFVVDPVGKSCEIFMVTADVNITRTGVMYYQPIPGKVILACIYMLVLYVVCMYMTVCCVHVHDLYCMLCACA